MPQAPLVLSSHYLPCLDYFAALRSADQICLDTHEHYVKQSYRNRCRILLTNKVIDLIVPIRHTGAAQALKDVQICYKQNWPHQHWQSIKSAYGKTPFFEHYAPLFEVIIQQKYAYLLELNQALLELCMQILAWRPALSLASAYVHPETEGLHDMRHQISPKKSSLYIHKPYLQAFGKTFVPNLSILDLIFAEGKHAASLLEYAQRMDK